MAHNPPSLLDTLYCQEDQWDDNDDDLETEDHCVYEDDKSAHTELHFTEQDFVWEEDELSSLFSKEEVNVVHNDVEKCRGEAVDWMLKVVAHYSFSAFTAVLAVNYLDRFMASFQFHGDNNKPWMTQLVAVSCLSLAAKMEETQVPLLLDLQVCVCFVCILITGQFLYAYLILILCSFRRV